jgi:sugar phosphate isomerase/epimerase
MKITRKKFLHTAAGAAAFAAIPSIGGLTAACAPATTGKPKRGVSIYSFTDYGELNVSMTLEDCFQEVYATGAHGIELLSSYIHGYPNPTDEWVAWWWEMMKKYELIPIEFGHFVDSKLYAPPKETPVQELYEMMVSDIRLAKKMGFTRARTRIGMDPEKPGMLEKSWKEWMEKSLPVLEETDIKVCIELHSPTPFDGPMVEDVLGFIEKTKTKYVGFNVDFGEFTTGRAPEALPESREAQEAKKRQEERLAQQKQQAAQQPAAQQQPPQGMGMSQRKPQQPKDIIPLLPYVYCCHAKFQNVNEECVDTTTPYPEVIDIMIKHNWDGYLLSEYEGPNKDVPGYTATQIRRQHVMLRKLLGA